MSLFFTLKVLKVLKTKKIKKKIKKPNKKPNKKTKKK
jgi:hypothetical protein